MPTPSNQTSRHKKSVSTNYEYTSARKPACARAYAACNGGVKIRLSPRTTNPGAGASKPRGKIVDVSDWCEAFRDGPWPPSTSNTPDGSAFRGDMDPADTTAPAVTTKKN